MERSYNIKKIVDIPVILANRINEPGMADILLDMDKCDFIGMARGSLDDPMLPKKAKEGKWIRLITVLDVYRDVSGLYLMEKV